MCNELTEKAGESKKVLLVVSSLLPGGAERVTLAIASYFHSFGLDPHLFIARPLPDKQESYAIPDGITVHYARFGTECDFIRPLVNSLLLRRVVRKIKPGWIVSLGAQYKTMRLAGCFEQNNTLLSERNYPKSFYSDHEYHEAQRCYEMATKVVFQTEAARNCFPSLDDKKCLIIPNAAPEGLPHWTGRDSKRVSFVGRLASQKNPKLLIEAFSMFYEKHRDWHLDIYGDGPLKGEIVELVAALGLTPVVSFHGNVGDAYKRVSKSGLYVSTSDYEGISNSLLEAIAMGVPVVCTDCAGGGASTVVSDDESGLLVPCGNAVEAAMAMSRIADDASLAARLSTAALSKAKAFSPSAIYPQWIKAIS